MRLLRWRKSLHWRPGRRTPFLGGLSTTHSDLWQPTTTRTLRWKSSGIDRSFFDFPLPEAKLNSAEPTPLADVVYRAREYGIPSEAKLAFEANVGHQYSKKSRMVDRIANRQDLELWGILLDFRFLRDGVHGAQDILYGMRFRGRPVKLYANDPTSECIRQQLTTIGATDKEVLIGLLHPLNGIARDLPSLFLDTVGQLLRLDKVQQASHVAGLLRTSHFRGRSDLLGLFDVFWQNLTYLSMKDFCMIHKQLPQSPIYAEVMAKLWRLDRADDAWFMHSYLLSCGDLPTIFEHIEPLVNDLARRERPLEPFLRNLEASGCSLAAQARRGYQRERARGVGISDSTLNVVTSNTLGVRPRKLSDEFVARAFATKAFSLEFILNSLRLFGLIEVGPLAVRELASGAGNLEELKQRFLKLEELEIDLGSSAFVTTVRNLCMSSSEVLLQAILNSDQHHEVFEDRETQKRLLATYYYQNDWPQVNRTLAILNHGKTDLDAQRRARRLLLQSAIVIRDWQGALQVIANMHKVGHTSSPMKYAATSMSLASLVDIIVPYSKPMRLWKQGYIKRGQYVTGILQDMTMAGIFVDKMHWRRALYLLGETGQIASLERLCIWLAWYYQSNVERKAVRPVYKHDHKVVVEELFDPKFQSAVIEWGFCIAPNNPSNSVRENAQRTMHLLRRLHASFGIPLSYRLIKLEYLKRMRHLFNTTRHVRPHMDYFDAVWSNDLSRIPRRHGRKRVTRAKYPTFDELESLRNNSAANPLSQQVENDVLEESNPVDEDVVKEFRPFTKTDESETVSSEGDDDSQSQDIVEYQDFFHPSSKEYSK